MDPDKTLCDGLLQLPRELLLDHGSVFHVRLHASVQSRSLGAQQDRRLLHFLLHPPLWLSGLGVGRDRALLRVLLQLDGESLYATMRLPGNLLYGGVQSVWVSLFNNLRGSRQLFQFHLQLYWLCLYSRLGQVSRTCHQRHRQVYQFDLHPNLQRSRLFVINARKVHRRHLHPDRSLCEQHL